MNIAPWKIRAKQSQAGPKWGQAGLSGTKWNQAQPNGVDSGWWWVKGGGG